MWLLKLHFQISALCALSIFGVFSVFWRKIIENGWAKGDGKERGILARLGRFVYAVLLLLIVSAIPFVNIAAVWKVLETASHKKEGADNANADA